MEGFVEPSEKPYLLIPASVPWKFKLVGGNSFHIVVPPTKGKLDYRVELMKYGYMLKKRMTKRDDDTSDNSENKNDIYSSNKSSQVFAFRCQHSGELAVYAKAAQSLDRNLSTNSSPMKSIIPKSNVRTRTAAGIEMAAQSDRIARTGSVANVKLRRMSAFGEQEFRCFPLYCYPKTWMTKRDLTVTLPRTSKTFHDLRRGAPDEIGNLKVEVLQCIGLPKMDKYSLTDAYCFIVCGSSTFVSDVIPDNCNPCWLPMSRRACIIPIHNAYSQVHVGVFDYDGEKVQDDFVGRVVIDIPQLQSGFRSMDVTLPLRECSRVYKRKRLGSIRLRLQLNWTQHGERAALLSYFPKNLSDVTKRMKSPKNPVTVVCPDAKSFYNVALTVYGKDVPGRYSKSAKKAVMTEVALIKGMLVYHTKRTVMDVVRWRNPILSLYLFCGWMHFVVTDSATFLPAFILSLILIFMARNYMKYHVNSAASNLFGHRTIGDMTRILFKRDNSKVQTPHIHQRNSCSILESVFLRIFGTPQVDATPKDSWKREDHAEFPFSTGSAYCKLSSVEAAARPIWEAARDSRYENSHDLDDDVSRDFSDEASHQFKMDDGSDNEYVDYSDSDDESYDEYLGIVEKEKVKIGKSRSKKKAALAQSESILATTEHTNVSLPDQNMSDSQSAKPGKSLSAQISGWHSRVQQANLHLFDDRVFMAEDRADAEKVLQINSSKNPIARMINPIMASIIKILEIEVSAFRAVFNILFWKDPMLSYWAMWLVFCSMIVVLIFPWRIFFFVVGLFGLGPQNYFLVDWYYSKSAIQEHGHQLLSNSTKSLNTHHKKEQDDVKPGGDMSTESSRNGHLLNNSPLLLRNNIQMKPDGKIREVIVPSVPFRYNRFYDWPPDPDLTTIRYIDKDKQ
mmetsp:Transcript_5729/g.10317  ORF Transcript_5729/g.10317 Transcript_5729/m.10317 type:complete len:902 (+) Transcript_5729:157-2862(+)